MAAADIAALSGLALFLIAMAVLAVYLIWKNTEKKEEGEN